MMYVAIKITERGQSGESGVVVGCWTKDETHPPMGNTRLRAAAGVDATGWISEAVPTGRAEAARAEGRIAVDCSVGSLVHRRRLADGLEVWRLTTETRNLSEECRPAEHIPLSRRLAWQID